MIFQLINRLKLLDKKRRIRTDAKRLGLAKYTNIEDLFTDYYHNRTWTGGKSETVSGSGSTYKKTRVLRESLARFLENYEIKSVFDAPCGDFNWFQHVDRKSIRYIGGDIVKDLVAENNRRYSDDHTSFLYFDILRDQAPEADVWLCRDVLLHLSNELIFRFLRNFAASRVPYLLASTYHRFPENLDIPTGTGRPVNLEIAPFCLPAPVYMIEDDAGSNRPKRLGLWDRSAIAALDWA